MFDKISDFLENKLSIGVIILLIQLFLFINAEWVYGKEKAPLISNILLVYLILQVAILSAFDMPLPTIKTNLNSLVNFLLMFLVASIVFSLMDVALFGGVAYQLVVTYIGFLVLHAFVIAYTEEIVFRWMLPKQIGLGDIVSNLLFGVFHLAVYKGSLIIVLFLMIFGYILSIVRDKFGIMGSIGVHFAWNLKALGVNMV